MEFKETHLKGAFIVDIRKIEDDRGYFGRAYCRKEFMDHGLMSEMVQTNVSLNKRKGTLRGFHYQTPPNEEAKLVRCTRGAIYDVIVDLRPESPTYLKWVGIELTEANSRMLYVPETFGHAFITLEDQTAVTYQVSRFYTPGAEGGIRWNDPAVGVQWPVEPTVISEKDQQWRDVVN